MIIEHAGGPYKRWILIELWGSSEAAVARTSRRRSAPGRGSHTPISAVTSRRSSSSVPHTSRFSSSFLQARSHQDEAGPRRVRSVPENRHQRNGRIRMPRENPQGAAGGPERTTGTGHQSLCCRPTSVEMGIPLRRKTRSGRPIWFSTTRPALRTGRYHRSTRTGGQPSCSSTKRWNTTERPPIDRPKALASTTAQCSGGFRPGRPTRPC